MEPLNPVTLESEITTALNQVSRSIKKVSDAYDAWKTSELAFKKAFALAYRDAQGSIKDREMEATIATYELAETLKDAEVTYKYTVDWQRACRDKLSAFQTLAKPVTAAYNAVGVAHG